MELLFCLLNGVTESRDQIQNLPRPDVSESLGYVMDAVSLVRRELDGSVPLIGFSGSPWTLATYMIEGGSSKAFADFSSSNRQR